MSENENEENGARERGFVVIDRRGREEEAPEEAPQGEEASSGPSEGAAPGQAKEGAGPSARLLRIDFSTFVLSLSTSALFHLGLVADPESGQRGEANLPLARQTIDTLEMLQEKTRGNLDSEEANLLESLLYELRMRFVESSRPSTP